MNSDLILKNLESKIIFHNITASILKEVEWKIESAKPTSIVFYKINEGKEDEFLKKIKEAQYGLLIINREIKERHKIKNLIIVKNDEWLECQKIILDQFYPFQFQNTKIVGITGTNGKTTTTDLTSQMAWQNGFKILTIGTLGIRKNGQEIISEGLTTPNYIDIRKTLHQHAQDVDLVVLEVSSHALVQERVYKMKFDAAAWTSFSQDHLDFHLNLEDYFKAKCQLIEKYLKPGAFLFVPSYEEELYFKLRHYSQVLKSRALLERKMRTLPLFFSSQFNKNNLELAWTINEFLWKKQIIFDFKQFKMTDGRFSIHQIRGKTVIIDFAHTPDALLNICSSTRQAFPDARLNLVFGCGGDRDKTKRPLMGKVAENEADFIYVTSDNPRFEKPQDIIADIVVGMSGANHQVIVDRTEAITKAFHEMKQGEVLIIAGKGHENYQIINGVKYEYTDYKVLENLMKN